MQSDPPLITTVIPTYRRPALLQRAIRSALNQTYPYLQVCVYDNASGDETAAVVAELAREDPRVKYHCHATNIGMNGNFAYGIAKVDTPFFSVLTDDDFLLPVFYETVLQGFERHPDAIFSAGSTISMTESGAVTHIPMNSWEQDGYFTPPEGLFLWTMQRCVYIQGYLFRREVLDKIGSLDPDVFNADFDYVWRVASRFPYVVSYTPCVVIIIHENQTTRTSHATVWTNSYAVMRERLAQNDMLALADRAKAQIILRETFAEALFHIGIRALRDRDFHQARQIVSLLAQDLGASRNSYILYIITFFCKYSRIAYHALNIAYSVRLRYLTFRSRQRLEQILDYKTLLGHQ